jgi:hypothetical protein
MRKRAACHNVGENCSSHPFAVQSLANATYQWCAATWALCDNMACIVLDTVATRRQTIFWGNALDQT